jgi:hypothetical protein
MPQADRSSVFQEGTNNKNVGGVHCHNMLSNNVPYSAAPPGIEQTGSVKLLDVSVLSEGTNTLPVLQ